MTCPDCATPVVPSNPVGTKCGVNLLEAFEKKAWAGLPQRPKKPVRRKTAAWVFVALASLCAAAAGFFAAAARWPKPLPPQSYVDSARGFSVTLPSGWRVAPVDGDGFGDALTLTDDAATISISVLKPGSSTPQAAAAQFAGADAKVSGGDTTRLDGARAERYEVSGGRTYLPSENKGKRRADLEAPAPAYESLEWKGELIVLPDGERDYALKFWSEKTDFEKRRGAFDALLASFRRARVTSPAR